MDYHVFPISRIRETFDRGASTDEAIAQKSPAIEAMVITPTHYSAETRSAVELTPTTRGTVVTLERTLCEDCRVLREVVAE